MPNEQNTTEPYEVARLHLPVSVTNLVAMTDLITAEYGDNVRARTEGNWMIMTKHPTQ